MLILLNIIQLILTLKIFILVIQEINYQQRKLIIE